jgi:hypothetical protein
MNSDWCLCVLRRLLHAKYRKAASARVMRPFSQHGTPTIRTRPSGHRTSGPTRSEYTALGRPPKALQGTHWEAHQDVSGLLTDANVDRHIRREALWHLERLVSENQELRRLLPESCRCLPQARCNPCRRTALSGVYGAARWGGGHWIIWRSRISNTRVRRCAGAMQAVGHVRSEHLEQ